MIALCNRPNKKSTHVVFNSKLCFVQITLMHKMCRYQIRGKIENAISSGVEFLKLNQEKDGSFIDFSLTGSPSIEWITAHVCWVLESVPNLSSVLKKSCHYLIKHRNENGSWGFNSNISGDCGTTSQALIVLKQNGFKLKIKSLTWLLKQQYNSGGFPTYPICDLNTSLNSWSIPHMDTTLYAVHALKTLNQSQLNRPIFTSLNHAFTSGSYWLKYQLKTGPLTAFWWEDPAYILWVQKKIRFNLKYSIQTSHRLLLSQPKNVTTLSFLLNDLSKQSSTKPEVNYGINVLLNSQLKDGSWACTPCLRVSLNTKFSSKMGMSPIYSGSERIFSTAHAVSSLFSIWSLM